MKRQFLGPNDYFQTVNFFLYTSQETWLNFGQLNWTRPHGHNATKHLVNTAVISSRKPDNHGRTRTAPGCWRCERRRADSTVSQSPRTLYICNKKYREHERGTRAENIRIDKREIKSFIRNDLSFFIYERCCQSCCNAMTIYFENYYVHPAIKRLSDTYTYQYYSLAIGESARLRGLGFEPRRR